MPGVVIGQLQAHCHVDNLIICDMISVVKLEIKFCFNRFILMFFLFFYIKNEITT